MYRWNTNCCYSVLILWSSRDTGSPHRMSLSSPHIRQGLACSRFFLIPRLTLGAISRAFRALSFGAAVLIVAPSTCGKFHEAETISIQVSSPEFKISEDRVGLVCNSHRFCSSVLSSCVSMVSPLLAAAVPEQQQAVHDDI